MGKPMKKAVSREFRELIIRKYPLVAENPRFMKMLRYLMFGTFFSDRECVKDALVLDKKTIESILGQEKNCFNSLVEFKRAFSKYFTWKEWQESDGNSYRGVPRTVHHYGFDDEVLTALSEENIRDQKYSLWMVEYIMNIIKNNIV